MSLHLRPHEVGNFIVLSLKAGTEPTLKEKGDDGTIGCDKMFFCPGRNGSSCNIIAVIVIRIKTYLLPLIEGRRKEPVWSVKILPVMSKQSAYT